MSETTVTCKECGERVPNELFCGECEAPLKIRECEAPLKIWTASQCTTRQKDELVRSPLQATVSGRRVLNSGTAGSSGKLNVDEGGAAVNATESKVNKKV